ncbi:MAG: YesL family protein [Lachnospiraceae bacterium]
MGRFFSIDSGFYRFMTKVADFGLITIFTIVCSIPLITIGPALTAMFYVALKLVRDEEGYIFRSYFKAFKDNFIQSFLAEMVILVAGWFMYLFMEVVYRWAMDGGGWFLKVVYFLQLGVCVVLIAGVIYLFPLISRFKNKLIFQIKNAILMAVKHVPQTIILLVVDFLLIMYTRNYPVLWLFDVGLIAFANSFVLASVFKLYMPKEESETEESPESEESVTGITEDTASEHDTDNE